MNFIGIGELIVDHYFIEKDKDLKYLNTRGGGTVWNVLATLGHLGNAKCYALGVYGRQNELHNIAIKELQLQRVNIDNLVSKKNKRSRVITETLINRSGNYTHRFTDKCLVCDNKPIDAEIARLKKSNLNFSIKLKAQNCLILDRLTKDRVEIIKDFRIQNPSSFTVLDIGRLSYLRYIPTPQILSNLAEIDILFIKDSVYKSITKRLKFDSSISTFPKIGKLKFIVITKGEYGAELIVCGKKRTHKISPPVVDKVIDSAGAGDAFLSYFLHYYFAKNTLRTLQNVINSLEKATLKLTTVLSEIGARGHLKTISLKSFPINRFKNSLLTEIREQIKSESIFKCPFCYSNSSRIKGKLRTDSSPHTIAKTMSDLTSRLLSTFDKQDAIKQCKEIFNLEGFAYVVGTGGSFSSANFVSQLLSHKSRLYSTAIKPLDYLTLVNKKSQLLLIISYSGSTLDYEAVIRKATTLDVDRIVLITHSQKPRLRTVISENRIFTHDTIINYSTINSKKERGFLSIAGTLIPSLLFYLASPNSFVNPLAFMQMLKEKKNKGYQQLSRFSNDILTNNCLEIFAGGYSWCAAVDFESKLIESGICPVQLHEFKDFSHGRFMYSLKKKNPKLVLQVDENPYVVKLIRTLKENGANVLILKSKQKGFMGAFELLVETQYFVHKLSHFIFGGNVDITKPKSIPSAGLELYRWKLSQDM